MNQASLGVRGDKALLDGVAAPFVVRSTGDLCPASRAARLLRRPMPVQPTAGSVPMPRLLGLGLRSVSGALSEAKGEAWIARGGPWQCDDIVHLGELFAQQNTLTG